MKNTKTFYTALILVLIAGLSRLVSHPMNFTPITAIVLFSMYAFEGKWKIIIPLSAIIFSDVLLEITRETGFHSGTWMVYVGFGLIALIGFALLQKSSISRVLGSSILGSTVFYLFTNFAFFYPSKAIDSAYGYAHSWEGVLASYTAAIPFFRNMLVGDILYTSILFGVFFLVKRFVLKPSLT